ncbi:MAG: hypothetical protein ACI4J7_04665, partial [Ruminiclostridium sp.]
SAPLLFFDSDINFCSWVFLLSRRVFPAILKTVYVGDRLWETADSAQALCMVVGGNRSEWEWNWGVEMNEKYPVTSRILRRTYIFKHNDWVGVLKIKKCYLDNFSFSLEMTKIFSL